MIYIASTAVVIILEIIYHDIDKIREREEKRFKENV
jgi:hypothetical protein|tara:strand:- start:1033 stop:1140 length:108 start_codon:yes stop_codon:yes gene_type:complete